MPLRSKRPDRAACVRRTGILCGLTPETFLHTPAPGDPEIVVVAPEDES